MELLTTIRYNKVKLEITGLNSDKSSQWTMTQSAIIRGRQPLLDALGVYNLLAFRCKNRSGHEMFQSLIIMLF